MESPDEHSPEELDVVWYDKLRMSEAQVKRAELICVLAIAACAAVGIALRIDSRRPGEPSAMSDCAVIGATTKRLACYDALAHQRAGTGPAKGATAPPLHEDSQF
ncbi:MAG TPA: hypothetical protein VHC71_13030 [Hyphomicrobium sp.]|jgi:anti-sigma-K factor RskA|nr:hypothetical protein [Hyphomicrobium sp.]